MLVDAGGFEFDGGLVLVEDAVAFCGREGVDDRVDDGRVVLLEGSQQGDVLGFEVGQFVLEVFDFFEAGLVEAEEEIGE